MWCDRNDQVPVAGGGGGHQRGDTVTESKTDLKGVEIPSLHSDLIPFRSPLGLGPPPPTTPSPPAGRQRQLLTQEPGLSCLLRETRTFTRKGPSLPLADVRSGEEEKSTSVIGFHQNNQTTEGQRTDERERRREGVGDVGQEFEDLRDNDRSRYVPTKKSPLPTKTSI